MSQARTNIKETLATYWKFIKPYKTWTIIILITVLLSQALLTLDQFFIKILVDKGGEYSAQTITKETLTTILIALLIAFTISSITKVILKWITFHYWNKVDVASMTDLKKHYFNHIIHLDHSFHTNTKTGALISKIIRGGDAIARINDIAIFEFAPVIFQILISITALLYFDKISALTIAITTILFITYTLIIQKRQEPKNIDANDTEDIERANLSDILLNIDSIKYFGKEQSIKKRYANIAETTKQKFLTSWNHYRELEAGQQAILAIGTIALLVIPTTQFLNGNTTLGTIIFIITTYTTLIVGELFSFVNGIRGMHRALTDIQPLFEYGKIKNNIKDKTGAKKLEIQKGTINYKNITFSYHKRKLFENFNLEIKENEHIALVGSSGSGKTTLIKLLYRLYDTTEGEIQIDGININEYQQESLRSELSIVPQECILFDDTIFNNIAFSNTKASKEEIWNAIKLSQLDKTIQELPLKEQTIVGERGVKLSGGEKQRISIARALLANKKILVLDEATSALDSETEHEIQKALEKLMKGRTSIIIAHRLSTIMNADKIIVMDKGKIAQQGKHEELINQEGIYQKLWNLQKGGYIK